MVCNRESFKNILKQVGQSTVEYVLLLLVVVTLAYTVFNSRAFKGLLGEDSKFFEAVFKKIAYAYRHGRADDEEDRLDLTRHNTFYNKQENRSRFFSPAETYPR